MREFITAKLADVSLQRFPYSGNLSGYCHIATGKIYDDKAGRFKDGQIVNTSRIVKFEDGLLHTQNSVYEVI